ncbi:Acyl-CoA synthetase (AMP-forming)/AMP-acid ligase II [Actinacidiphila rubida]|uniref:Acyl-CoA synthetase (AMP-forming)/AMP-acid ligase II n=1 Tax=Actinacidiphila rubida TaxID=310780 RepID=A0A1H8NLS1_9ACTN|nr:Acyl-CoA synthetase (AMP-forming)/AMP-acid ligase II [Actinacidiphila rubida]
MAELPVFRSEYPDVAAVDLPIHDAVLGRAAEFGDRPALIDGVDGTTLTYAQLDSFTRRIAAALAESGLRKGDVLALHSPNTIAYPAVFYGATRAGAAVTTVHPLATADEFARQLRDSGATWLVTVSPLLETAREAARAAGGIREILVCDSADGHRSVLDLLRSTAPEPVVDLDPARDLAALPYSSGTTAAPKGVMLTHRNISTNLAQLDPMLSIGPGHRILAVLPLFHIYGLTALMNVPLRNGATVVVLPRFDLEQFLTTVETHRVQGLFVAPPIVLALAKHPAVAAHDLSSLEYVLSAAAPLDADLAEACSRRLGLPPILQAYGMTELSPGTHVVPLSARDAPPGTVGKLVPGTEMRIVPLDGTPAGGAGAAGVAGRQDVGEIHIRGPQVMKGYLGRPEETAAMIDEDGWLRTGDVGRVDADGWLHVVDRVKELIKYKGYQVPPAELEAVLLTHPDVADAAVIGVLDADGNEVPKAYVVPQPRSALTAAEVIAHVASHVAPYKKVRSVEFTEAIPRASSGKILRRELRALEREKRPARD